jgi:hypothetical protein
MIKLAGIFTFDVLLESNTQQMSSLEIAHFAHEVSQIDLVDFFLRNEIIIVGFARILNDFNLPFLDIDFFLFEIFVSSGLLFGRDVFVAGLDETDAGFLLRLLVAETVLVSAFGIRTENVLGEKFAAGIVLEVEADVFEAEDELEGCVRNEPCGDSLVNLPLWWVEKLRRLLRA